MREGFSGAPEQITPKEKISHLKEGVKPIIACVGTEVDFAECATPLKTIDYGDTVDLREAKALVGGYANVDYYAHPADLVDKEYKNSGEGSYVISTVDSKDKMSVSYANCTGVLVSGQDKETGENISFLSHQDPWFFVRNKEKTDKFTADLRGRLEELKSRSAPGTIDARILGGNYIARNQGSKEDYVKSIEILSDELTKTLGFEPTVISGPKLQGGQDDVFFDNKNKRLYISRPKVGDASTEPYKPKKVTSQVGKFQENRSFLDKLFGGGDF